MFCRISWIFISKQWEWMGTSKNYTHSIILVHCIPNVLKPYNTTDQKKSLLSKNLHQHNLLTKVSLQIFLRICTLVEDVLSTNFTNLKDLTIRLIWRFGWISTIFFVCLWTTYSHTSWGLGSPLWWLFTYKSYKFIWSYTKMYDLNIKRHHELVANSNHLFCTFTHTSWV